MEKHIAEFVNYDIINRIVAGYEKFPQNMLGPHFVGDGYVIVAFHPSATRMTIHVEGDLEAKDMERIHDQGVYAIYIKGKTYHKYKITKYFDGGSHFTSEDPYSFESVITADDCYMFGSGVHYEIYEKLGAHPMALDGVFADRAAAQLGEEVVVIHAEEVRKLAGNAAALALLDCCGPDDDLIGLRADGKLAAAAVHDLAPGRGLSGGAGPLLVCEFL